VRKGEEELKGGVEGRRKGAGGGGREKVLRFLVVVGALDPRTPRAINTLCDH
jgi:hypothetical protein